MLPVRRQHPGHKAGEFFDLVSQYRRFSGRVHVLAKNHKTTTHSVELMRVQFANFVVQLGHVIPLFLEGAIPSQSVVAGYPRQFIGTVLGVTKVVLPVTVVGAALVRFSESSDGP